MSIAWAYTGLWLSACGLALATAACLRRDIPLFRGDYWRLLLRPWKLVTFALATGSLVTLAPFAHDPSWDRVDATFMAVLTFSTAPWVVASLYRRARGETGPGVTYVALCTLLFSSTWSYDLYLFLRDGVYPKTWLGNLIVGPLLYAGGGLFWSLEGRTRGFGLAFTDPRWPATDAGSGFRGILIPAMVLMALAAAAFLPYLWPTLRGVVWGR